MHAETKVRSSDVIKYPGIPNIPANQRCRQKRDRDSRHEKQQRLRLLGLMDLHQRYDCNSRAWLQDDLNQASLILD